MRDLNEYMAYAEASRSTDPLQWWKGNEQSFPIVSKLAKRVLGVPASSAPSERVFSNLGNVANAKRSRMTPETSEKLVLLQRCIPALNLLNV